MDFRLLLRPPLVWLVLFETIVVGAIVAFTWHLLQPARPSPITVAQVPAALPSSATRTPRVTRSPRASPRPSQSPGVAGAVPPTGPTPGLRSDAQFMSNQIQELNRVEASFETLEWRITKTVADAIQSYLERVVLPSIDHVDSTGR
jgi:hypothetical protein